MVIGNHRVNAERFCVSDLLPRGNAVIDGNDQSDALRGKHIYGGAVHAVALALARRYVVGHVRADGFQIGIQKRGRGDAVSVVVAVNADRFPAVNRLTHARRRLVHIPDFHRVGNHTVIIEEILDFHIRGDTANLQQHRDDRRQVVFFLNF